MPALIRNFCRRSLAVLFGSAFAEGRGQRLPRQRRFVMKPKAVRNELPEVPSA